MLYRFQIQTSEILKIACSKKKVNHKEPTNQPTLGSYSALEKLVIGQGHAIYVGIFRDGYIEDKKLNVCWQLSCSCFPNGIISVPNVNPIRQKTRRMTKTCCSDQAGTTCGASSQPDLIQNHFLIARMLRCLRHSRQKVPYFNISRQKVTYFNVL